jgi:hypothetical protein
MNLTMSKLKSFIMLNHIMVEHNPSKRIKEYSFSLYIMVDGNIYETFFCDNFHVIYEILGALTRSMW